MNSSVQYRNCENGQFMVIVQRGGNNTAGKERQRSCNPGTKSQHTTAYNILSRRDLILPVAKLRPLLLDLIGLPDSCLNTISVSTGKMYDLRNTRLINTQSKNILIAHYSFFRQRLAPN